MKLSLKALGLLALVTSSGIVACSTTGDGDETEDAVISTGPRSIHDHAQEDVVPDHLILKGETLLWTTTKRGDAAASTIWRKKAGAAEAAKIADIDGRVFEMTLYGTNLFVVPDETGGILTLPASPGATPKTIYTDRGTKADAEGVITSITATIDGVFAARDDGAIIEIENGGGLRVAKTGGSLPRSLHVWEDANDRGRAYIAYVDGDDSEDGDTQFIYAPLRKNQNGAFELVQAGWKSVRGLARAHAITTDAKNVYIATWGWGEAGDGGEIIVAPIDGSSAPRVLASGLLRPTNVLVDDRGIYFATGPGPDETGTPRGGAVMAIRKEALASTGEPEVLCFAQGTSPARLAQNADALFWVAQTEKQIMTWGKASVWVNARPCDVQELAPRAPAEP